MSWIHSFPAGMGKGIQVCQGIHCLILTLSVDGDSGKLSLLSATQICWSKIKLLRKHIMEKCVGIPCMKWRAYKGSLKPHHAHAMLMLEDGNRDVMEARHSAKRRHRMWWEAMHKGCNAVMLTGRALMSGSSCLPTTFTTGSSACSHTFQVNPGLSELCKNYTGGFNCEVKPIFR